eukprot:CAMPEP_0202484346 /NCGR_PEP_ID=MMETSP1361-20130828/3437_1 /ASSEMBLY_ACC=CAM_ASM_000849 /TAXON_ID=210615 /ORGANISM="Staurosira complex sp., Strain CCMP2646" /LENGTH=325 /DNA_ID=CAMNT_0049112955 /DNA_START=36 /DNA_END=1013 /DNA_ORIENTATION=+
MIRYAIGFCCLARTSSFTVGPSRQSSRSSCLSALTERQMQFWEDVDEGLTDVEQVYASRGQDIDRIRTFAKSARGEIPPPKGDAPGHQPSEEHVEGLTARPIWDVIDEPGLFPWATGLEESADVIIQEFEEKLARDQKMFASDSAWQNQVMGQGWSAIRLQRLGVWNSEVCAEFPKTYELLQSLKIPLAVRGVCFARQAPGSGVEPHSDGRNFILTSHMGIQVPEGCWMKVGEETRTWKEGTLTTLDTSFEHSTGNPSDSERVVLIIDFWHPELTEAERAALEYVYDLRNQFETGKVPIRKPRALQEQEQEGGMAGLWNSLTGGK